MQHSPERGNLIRSNKYACSVADHTTRRKRDKQGIRERLMARHHLRRVAACRRELDKTQQALYEHIVAAVDSGEAQADVARFARLSQQRISQIVKDAKQGHTP